MNRNVPQNYSINTYFNFHCLQYMFVLKLFINSGWSKCFTIITVLRFLFICSLIHNTKYTKSKFPVGGIGWLVYEFIPKIFNLIFHLFLKPWDIVWYSGVNIRISLSARISPRNYAYGIAIIISFENQRAPRISLRKRKYLY